MKLFWILVAGVCIAIAAYLALSGRLEAAFVIAAIGIVAWFLNYRVQMTEVIATADLEDANHGEDTNED